MSLIGLSVAIKAINLGLKARPESEWPKMKPGYYMDLNANLAVVKKIKSITSKKYGEGLDIDADVISCGDVMDDAINQQGIIYWEYLGEL